MLFCSVSSSLRCNAPPVLSHTRLDVRHMSATFLNCSEFCNHQQCSSGQLTHTKHTNAKNNAVEIQSKFAIKYKTSCKYMKTLVPNATFSCDGAHAQPQQHLHTMEFLDVQSASFSICVSIGLNFCRLRWRRAWQQ